MHQVNIAKAINAGLTFRPLAKTIADTLAWDNTRLSDAPRANGISPERESELIDLL